MEIFTISVESFLTNDFEICMQHFVYYGNIILTLFCLASETNKK